MILKICKHHLCKKTFRITSGDRRLARKEYCTQRCRENASAWRYAQKKPKKQAERRIITCKVCNIVFSEYIKPGPVPKYCSTICRRTADLKMRKNGTHGRVVYKNQCKKCMLCFETLMIDQEYCSQLCFAKKIELPRRRCFVCNRFFSPHNKKVLCCSFECGRIKAGDTLRIYEPGDPRKIISKAISRGINQALKARNGSKRGRQWESLVNFTKVDLVKHLEKQFKPGMTWKNHGEWHIDHVVPISAHNFKSVKHRDFKRCWALKNLQPLWAKDNLSKNAKLKKPFQPSLLI